MLLPILVPRFVLFKTGYYKFTFNCDELQPAPGAVSHPEDLPDRPRASLAGPGFEPRVVLGVDDGRDLAAEVKGHRLSDFLDAAAVLGVELETAEENSLVRGSPGSAFFF